MLKLVLDTQNFDIHNKDNAYLLIPVVVIAIYVGFDWFSTTFLFLNGLLNHKTTLEKVDAWFLRFSQ